MTDVACASSWGAGGSPAQSQNEPDILLETVCCPGCSGSDFEPILTAGDHLTRLGGEFSLVRCTACDLTITNPRPVMESLGYFYPKEYSPYEADDVHRPNWWLRLLERSALRCQYGYPSRSLRRTGTLARRC